MIHNKQLKQKFLNCIIFHLVIILFFVYGFLREGLVQEILFCQYLLGINKFKVTKNYLLDITSMYHLVTF